MRKVLMIIKKFKMNFPGAAPILDELVSMEEYESLDAATEEVYDQFSLEDIEWVREGLDTHKEALLFTDVTREGYLTTIEFYCEKSK